MFRITPTQNDQSKSHLLVLLRKNSVFVMWSASEIPDRRFSRLAEFPANCQLVNGCNALFSTLTLIE